MKHENRWFWAAFLLLLGIHYWMIGSSRILPFVDLPNHLANATIYRHIGEPGNQFAHYYSVHPLFPNANVVHLAFAGSKIFPSVEFANRVFYMLYATLIPLGVFLLIREAGGNRWYTLLSFLLIFNLNAVFGFTGFTIAIPIVLFVAWTAIRSFRGSWLWTAAAGILLVLNFCAHALTFIFGFSVYCLLCLQRRGAWPRLLAAIPAAMVFAAWWARRPSEESTFRYMRDYYSNHYIANIPVRLTFPLMDFYQLLPGIAGPILAIVITLAIFAPLVKYRKALLGGLRDRPAAVLLLFGIFCCMTLPPEIPREPVLYQRFSVFVFLGAIVLLSGLPSPKLRTGVMFSAALAVALLRLHYFHEFNRENAGFDARFLPPSNDRMAGIMYDYGFHSWPLYIHFPNYQIIWNKGIASTAAIDYRFGVVRRRATTDELPVYREWISQDAHYLGDYDAMEYLLVRGNPPTEWLDATRHPPGFEEVRRSGNWRLLRRRNPGGHGILGKAVNTGGRVAQLAEQLTLNQ